MFRKYKSEGDEEKLDPVPLGGDSDDDEANEDLSLKILEKALSRRAVDGNQNGGVFEDSNETSMVDLCASSFGTVPSVLVHGETAEIVKGKERVKKNKKIKLETTNKTANFTKEEGGMEMVEVVTDEKTDTVNGVEIDESTDRNISEKTNNMVLQKLLRGRRYFDPPDSGWETCYNCGEEGHIAINCPTATKRKKPCFVCGSLEHGARQCAKAQDCFICKKSGHRAKDCPDKHKSGFKSGNICLKCGDSGHDMFSCKNDYSHDDLKDIQCYVCRSFGHLCCVNFVNSSPRTISCYRCGQLGHTGLSCRRLPGETTGNELPQSCYRCGGEGHFKRDCPNHSLDENELPHSCFRCGGEGHFKRDCPNHSLGENELPHSCFRCGGGHFKRDCPNNSSVSFPQGRDSPSACYKCGEGGHFARYCPNSSSNSFLPASDSPRACYNCGKGGHFARGCSSRIPKRNHETSTPTLKPHRKMKDNLGYKSAPLDLGVKSKRKKIRNNNEERGLSTPQKSRRRGGWIAEDPEDFSARKTKDKKHKSPSTPSGKKRRPPWLNHGERSSGSHSSRRSAVWESS